MYQTNFYKLNKTGLHPPIPFLFLDIKNYKKKKLIESQFQQHEDFFFFNKLQLHHPDPSLNTEWNNISFPLPYFLQCHHY